MKPFLFTLLGCLFAASAMASTLSPTSFTGTFSYHVGAGERCDYDQIEQVDIGCFAVTDSWNVLISFDSADPDIRMVDDAVQFYFGSTFLSYSTVTRSAYHYDYGGIGGGQIEHIFSGDGGQFTFWDDDYPNFGTIIRPITGVQLSLVFTENPVNMVNSPLPPGLALGLGGIGAFVVLGWRRKSVVQ